MRINAVLIFAASLACTLLPLTTQAGGVQPGLWEMHSKVEFTKGGPQIPPDDLARMKQAGIDPFGDNVEQRCITPKQAADEFDFGKAQPPGDDGCSVQNPKHVGDTYSGEYVCDGQIKGRGDFKATLTPTGFSGVNTLAGTARDAPPQQGLIEMRSEFSGKFLNADCGAVAP